MMFVRIDSARASADRYTCSSPAICSPVIPWYEIDVNYYVIWLLGKLGLATDIYAAKPEAATKTAGR